LRARGLKTRIKLLPLLLLCLSTASLADGVTPLRVSPDLIKRSGTDGASRSLPVSREPATPKLQEAGQVRDVVATPVQGEAVESGSGPSAESRPASAPVAEVDAAPATDAAPAIAPAVAPVPATDDARVPGATEISALRIIGLRAVELVAEGDAELTRDDVTLTADRLVYNELTDEASAEGNVRFMQGEDWMTGTRAHLIVHEWVGEIDSPHYAFTRASKGRPDEPAATVSGSGQADVMLLEGENQYRLKNATWTTCEPESRDWYIKASELTLDYDREVATARGGSVVFKDVPILWWPWMEFPLAEQRQSGFLVPTVGVSNKTGFDVSVPYYWNIAPNYDATVTPRYMGRRGLQLGGEVRYLKPTYAGEMRAEWMPNDSVTGEQRTLGALQHIHRITPRLSASLDLNWVSDDAYFEDLSSQIAVASRVNLLREGRLNYAGGWWNASALAQSYQTLDPLSEGLVVGPYRRLPQLLLTANRADLPGGSTLAFSGEYVEFKHEDALEGSRFHVYPQVSLPIQRSAYFVTPKVGVHHTKYDLQRPFIDGGRTSITRTLPIFTLDSGLFFDREADFFGQTYLQTLEPRLFYVNVPYRKQSDIPVFDTGRYDFGFAQIFSENRYSGIDRVGDANELTAAVSSRLIDPASGAERMRVTFGQRFYFRDQEVTLPGESVRSNRRTDTLAAVSGQVTRTTSVDSAWRYDPFESETQRFNFAVRYQPQPGHALNLSYRYARDQLEGRDGIQDVDISGQWPLGNRWYGVGRVTRSIKENRITEAVAGVEYISTCGCWVFRTAAHRFATNEDRVTNALFVQLELTGLGSIGASPVNLLTRSVPGYGKINESMSDRFFGAD